MNLTSDIEREHEAVSELLPLLVGGVLADSERAAIDTHLARCNLCRAELELLRSVQARFAASDPAASPDAAARSLERVLSRVQAERKLRTTPAPWQRLLQVWLAWPATARWMVAGQAALVAALALLLIPLWLAPPASKPDFETAAGPNAPLAAGPRARVVWRDDASAASQRSLLAGLDANVVAGPSAAGFYTVQFGPGAAPDAVARLRARTDLVQWAEPE